MVKDEDHHPKFPTDEQVHEWDWHVPGISGRPVASAGPATKRIARVMDLPTVFKWGMKRDIMSLYQPLDGTGPILNLGAGNSQIAWLPEWQHRVVNMDWPEWNADVDGLVMHEDGSVDGIFAFHFLEHLEQPIEFLRECERVLGEGAPMTIVVPYYTAQLQAQDLSHKYAFCEETWKVLFNTAFYDQNSMLDGNVVPWRFVIGTNVIMGVAERNLCLVTQLIKM